MKVTIVSLEPSRIGQGPTVRVVFYPTGDERRHTAFYSCDTNQKAEWLIEMLSKAVESE